MPRTKSKPISKLTDDKLYCEKLAAVEAIENQIEKLKSLEAEKLAEHSELILRGVRRTKSKAAERFLATIHDGDPLPTSNEIREQLKSIRLEISDCRAQLATAKTELELVAADLRPVIVQSFEPRREEIRIRYAATIQQLGEIESDALALDNEIADATGAPAGSTLGGSDDE